MTNVKKIDKKLKKIVAVSKRPCRKAAINKKPKPARKLQKGRKVVTKKLDVPQVAARQFSPNVLTERKMPDELVVDSRKSLVETLKFQAQINNNPTSVYNLRLNKARPPKPNATIFDLDEEATCISREVYEEKYREYRKKIGEGGFGKVYPGVRLDGRPVAIKKVRRKLSCDTVEFQGKDVPEEFVFQLQASLISKAIVRPLDFCEDKTHHIIIMERPEKSISLEQYMDQKDVIPNSEIKSIFSQLVKTVEKLHKSKIIHRDIKAENILVDTNTKKIKLIDFGCAANDQKADFDYLCGTEQQFPPEWFITNRYSGKHLDLWCMGQVLYFLAENSYPFETVQEITKCQIVCKRANGQLKDLILKMLHLNKSERPTLNQVKRHPFMTTKL